MTRGQNTNPSLVQSNTKCLYSALASCITPRFTQYIHDARAEYKPFVGAVKHAERNAGPGAEVRNDAPASQDRVSDPVLVFIRFPPRRSQRHTMADIVLRVAFVQAGVERVEYPQVPRTRLSFGERVADVVDGVCPGIVKPQGYALAPEVPHFGAHVQRVVIGESTIRPEVDIPILVVDAVAR